MFRNPRALLAIATALCLMGCGTSSPDRPPPVRVETVRLSPPPALLADIPPPTVPDKPETRAEIDQMTLALTAWGTALRARLNAIREWAAASD